jgi:hypothetical protein
MSAHSSIRTAQNVKVLIIKRTVKLMDVNATNTKTADLTIL